VRRKRQFPELSVKSREKINEEIILPAHILLGDSRWADLFTTRADNKGFNDHLSVPSWRHSSENGSIHFPPRLVSQRFALTFFHPGAITSNVVFEEAIPSRARPIDDVSVNSFFSKSPLSLAPSSSFNSSDDDDDDDDDVRMSI